MHYIYVPVGNVGCTTLNGAVQVTDGDGRVLVTAVGPRSEWGLIMDKVTVEEQQDTPLQQKLGTQLPNVPGCLSCAEQVVGSSAQTRRASSEVNIEICTTRLRSNSFTVFVACSSLTIDDATHLA